MRPHTTVLSTEISHSAGDNLFGHGQPIPTLSLDAFFPDKIVQKYAVNRLYECRSPHR